MSSSPRRAAAPQSAAPPCPTPQSRAAHDPLLVTHGIVLSIVEPDRKVHLHRHLAPHPAHHPHHMRVPLPRRHKVHQAHLAVLRSQTSSPPPAYAPHIAASYRLHLARRRYLPVPVVARPQQRRKTGPRRERRPAQPVDRSLARHQRRRLAVPNQAIIFNRRAVQRPRSSSFVPCHLAPRLLRLHFFCQQPHTPRRASL